jgi:hypothetical protein
MALGTSFVLSATGVASGTTTTETMITLNLFTGASNQGTATVGVASASSFVMMQGRHYVIDSIVFASRGNATATAQVTTFTVRFNAAGTAVVGSSAAFSARTATPATALAWDRFAMVFPSGGFEVNIGDGTMCIGISANAVFVTNAPTWDVMISGHWYF